MAAKSQRARPVMPATRAPARPGPKLKVIEGGRAGGRGGKTAAPGARTLSTGRATKRAPAPRAGTLRATGSSVRGRSSVVQSARGIGVGLTALAVCGFWVFSLVLMNIYVAQSSFRLAELQKQVGIEEDRHRRMRYEVSVAESPARLAQIAEEVGLVAPAHQESLVGLPEDSGIPSAEVEDAGRGGNLKALLAGKP